MTRRHFLATMAAVPAAQPARPTIARITLATMEGRFHKFVAMNSYDRAPKGHTYQSALIRIRTSDGVEGVGPASGINPQLSAAMRRLIGANPLELYEMRDGRITSRAPAYADVLSRYRFLDGALFDLIGKVAGKPAWKLIGESARDRVEVYDGTLYFSDVWFHDRGVRAVVEEAEEAQKKGYTGIKLKVGRGFRWMPPEEGLRRDVEVVRAVRKAVGPKTRIMADANNAHQKSPENAWRFVSETAGTDVYWYEELFPEEPGRYAALRARMRQAGIRSLIADGESVRDVTAFEPYLKPERLMDVLQMDIRQAGFVDNAQVARMAAEAGAVAVPHNWASQMGFLMGLQLAKAVAAVPAAEDDRSTCDVIVPESYEFRNGFYSVPDKPGMSIRIDEAVYEEKCKPGEVVIA